jgi:hypothetical protein
MQADASGSVVDEITDSDILNAFVRLRDVGAAAGWPIRLDLHQHTALRLPSLGVALLDFLNRRDRS